MAVVGIVVISLSPSISVEADNGRVSVPWIFQGVDDQDNSVHQLNGSVTLPPNPQAHDFEHLLRESVMEEAEGTDLAGILEERNILFPQYGMG